jgi:large subunit ribosomal protein L22
MSRAILKFIRLSPTKARLIAREVQGMNAELALASLEFMPNKAAKIISKVIASAVANGEYEPEEVIISSCRVDKGPSLRRFRPRARGSASRIMKPTSHILVEVAPEGKKEEPKKTVKKSEPKKATKTVEPKKESDKKASSKTSSDVEKKESKKSTKKSDSIDLNDLKLLSGVGPAVEKKLHEQGITSIEQVANLSKEEIAKLDEKIGIKGKIEDTWQKEAKELIKNSKKGA